MHTDSKMLSPKQVAELLAVNHEQVLAWIRSSQLPAIDVSRRAAKRARYRIALADLEVFEQRRRIQPARPISQRKSRPPQAGVIEFF